jgi:8-oxo-dGTP diphosphatase
MPYTPILATLGYVRSPDGRDVLMVRRDRRRDDQHFGKYNGLGGKIERDEDPVSGMKRELYEEARISVDKMRLAGTISWPGFGKAGEDWFGFIFVIDRFTGDPPSENEEGSLLWVAQRDVMTLPLWEGDRLFLPLVFAEPLRVFHGVMPYQGGKPLGWSYNILD